jgi:hypothetical protein
MITQKPKHVYLLFQSKPTLKGWFSICLRENQKLICAALNCRKKRVNDLKYLFE